MTLQAYTIQNVVHTHAHVRRHRKEWRISEKYG